MNHAEKRLAFLSKVPGEEIYPWLYALGILFSEILVVVNPQAGILVHISILAGLLIKAAFCYRQQASFRFYLALTLAPLIRILSLSLPLAAFPLVYWYAVTSLPLLAGAAAVARVNGYRQEDIGLCKGKLLLQTPVALTGIPLGIAEYFILQPQPLILSLGYREVFLPALILLVCTGFTEEVVFRGVMQKAAVDFLGRKVALILVSFVFAVLHVTHLSALDVLFVFGVAVFFTLAVYRTGSLLGVTLAHGLTNITLYLIWPFIFR